MANKLMTKEDVRAWCQETADWANKQMETMSPEERKEFIQGINDYAACLGGFPQREKKNDWSI